MSEKTTGYGLLGTGLVIMFFALIYILLVFTGVIKPVELFNIQAPKLDITSLMPVNTSMLGQNLTLPKKEMEIIPTEQFNLMLNLSATFFLMGFIMTFGSKIASLGVMFLRPVKVSLKEEKTQPLSSEPIPQPIQTQ